MAIFGNKPVEKATEDVSLGGNINNIIAKGTSINGDFEAAGNIRFDGKIKGNIRCKSKLVTGKGSLVDGNVYAQNAEVEGEIIGTIDVVEMLILKSSAVIQGDIRTTKLVVEAGAKFNGTCKMGDNIVKPIENVGTSQS
jgi:cytoskeletal protein CcmA (bactofilin family)